MSVKEKLKGGSSVVLYDESVRPMFLRRRVSGNVVAGEYAPVPRSIRRYFPSTPHRVIASAGVHDEGNCFYDTIASTLNVDDWHHQNRRKRRQIGLRLREVVSKTLTRNAWERFWENKKVPLKHVPGHAAILKQMNNYKTWADVFAILYVVEVLNLNLLVFDVATGKLYCGTHNPNPNNTTIFMAWIAHSHFEPLMEVDTRPRNGKIRVKIRFSERDEILQHVLRLYAEEECPAVTIHELLRRRRARQRARQRARSRSRRKR